MNPSRSSNHAPNPEAYHSNCFHRDFEEDDENPDWVSELKKQVGRQDVCDGKLLGECAWAMWGDTDDWKQNEDWENVPQA